MTDGNQELQVRTVYDLLIHAAKRQAATEPAEIANEVMAELLEKDLTKVPFNAAIAYVAIRNRRISNHRRRTALKNGGAVKKVSLRDTDTSDPAPNPEQALLIREKVARTAKAAATLPSASREVLRLWKLGYTSPEIAKVLGTTDYAVRARFRRALEHLRTALTEKESPDD